jgi:ribosome-associated protein YbcJ (S4-like RNA binding protein)
MYKFIYHTYMNIPDEQEPRRKSKLTQGYVVTILEYRLHT